jgi:hypothetical protein
MRAIKNTIFCALYSITAIMMFFVLMVVGKNMLAGDEL